MRVRTASLRREYRLKTLSRDSVHPDPIEQFRIWFGEAVSAKLPEPNAMTLATASREGVPSARLVLLKEFDEQGFVFYTNYRSRKARDLAENPRAALVFYWSELERQVRISGPVSKVSRERSEAYFRSRPRLARLGALASRQSEPVAGRAALESAMAELVRKYPDEDIPLPDDWGGYCVHPEQFEYWQGRANRLHDRIAYIRRAEAWEILRLSP